ncbi:MAG: hypothetical protein ACRCUX_14110, partial [Beijerinckiaceae bacterium]
MRLPAILSAWAALTGAAFAFSDSATGFAVAPPAPFTTEPTQRRQFDVGAGVISPAGKPPIVGETKYICEAGFKSAPQNASLTRAQINTMIESKEWVNLARAALELAFSIEAQNHFTLRGYRGMEFHARPKLGPGHENVRMSVSMVETPKGRVTVICGTTRA